MSSDNDKQIKGFLESLMKGRVDEGTRNSEVLDTIEAHHGKYLRAAADAHIGANRRSIELITIISQFVPDELRPVCIDLLGGAIGEGCGTSYALAATLHNPNQPHELAAKEVDAVKKLVTPLIHQVAETRKHEAKMAHKAFDEFMKGKGREGS